MRSAGAAPVGRIGVALVALGLAGCAPGGLRRVTDARGRFDFGAVPPARDRLEAQVPGWRPYRTELMLRSGGAAEVEI